MSIKNRWLVAALVGLAFLSAQPAEALAQSNPPTAQAAPKGNKVKVEVMVAHANNSGKIDPALKSVMNQLKFTKYSGAKLLARHPAMLGVNQEATVPVAGNRKVKVQLMSKDAKSAKVRVRLYEGSEKKFDTTLTVPRNRSVLFGGPRYQGGQLVIPVTVTY